MAVSSSSSSQAVGDDNPPSEKGLGDDYPTQTSSNTGSASSSSSSGDGASSSSSSTGSGSSETPSDDPNFTDFINYFSRNMQSNYLTELITNIQLFRILPYIIYIHNESRNVSTYNLTKLEQQESLFNGIGSLSSNPSKLPETLYVASNLMFYTKKTTPQALIENYQAFFNFVDIVVKRPAHFKLDVYATQSLVPLKVSWVVGTYSERSEIDNSSEKMESVFERFNQQKWYKWQTENQINLAGHKVTVSNLGKYTQNNLVFKFGKYLAHQKRSDPPRVFFNISSSSISTHAKTNTPTIRSSFFSLYHLLVDTSSLTHILWNPKTRNMINTYIPLDNSAIHRISILWFSIFQPLLTGKKFETQLSSEPIELPFEFNLVNRKNEFSLKNFQIIDTTEKGEYVVFHSILINVPLIAFQILTDIKTGNIILPAYTYPLLSILYDLVRVGLDHALVAITDIEQRYRVLKIYEGIKEIVGIDTENIYRTQTDSFSGLDIKKGIEIIANKPFNPFYFYLANYTNFGGKISKWSDGTWFNYRSSYPDPRENYFRETLDELHFNLNQYDRSQFLKYSIFNMIFGLVMYSCTCCEETYKSLKFDTTEKKIQIQLSDYQSPDSTDIEDVPSLVSYCKIVLKYFGNEVLPNLFPEVASQSLLKPVETTISIVVTSFVRFFVLNVMQTSGDLPSQDLVHSVMSVLDPATTIDMIALVATVVTSILTKFPGTTLRADKIAAYFSAQLAVGHISVGYFHFYYFVLTECTSLPVDSKPLKHIRYIYDHFYRVTGLYTQTHDIAFKDFHDGMVKHFDPIILMLCSLVFINLNLLDVESIDNAVNELKQANSLFLEKYRISTGLPKEREEEGSYDE